jgi:hypothetical protein
MNSRWGDFWEKIEADIAAMPAYERINMGLLYFQRQHSLPARDRVPEEQVSLDAKATPGVASAT